MSDLKTAEELDNDKERLHKNESVETEEFNSPKKKWEKWQKILAGIIICVFLLLLSGVSAFGILRSRGANGLKAEEQYMTYNGKEYRYREDVINILCLGIDKTIPLSYIEEGRNNLGMSDTIIVVSIDIKKNEVKCIAIPRDTMAEVQITKEGKAVSKEIMQICYQYAYGVSMEQSNRLTMDAVSNLLCDIPIQRCCTINFEAIMEMNEAVGGVDVVVPEDLTEWDPNLIYGATVHLEGRSAQNFIQVRNTHSVDGAALRTQRQKQYILAFIEKAKSLIAEDPTFPIKLFQELQDKGYMCTDITMEDIAYLMPEVLDISFTDDMIQVLPGESVLGDNGLAEYHVDEDMLKKIVVDIFYEEM